MDKCVHKWHFFEESVDGCFCVKGCHGRLSRKEAESRLNATERLSAGCFNCKKTIQETHLKQFPSGYYTCRDCDIAYADILEGKQ